VENDHRRGEEGFTLRARTKDKAKSVERGIDQKKLIVKDNKKMDNELERGGAYIFHGAPRKGNGS